MLLCFQVERWPGLSTGCGEVSRILRRLRCGLGSSRCSIPISVPPFAACPSTPQRPHLKASVNQSQRCRSHRARYESRVALRPYGVLVYSPENHAAFPLLPYTRRTNQLVVGYRETGVLTAFCTLALDCHGVVRYRCHCLISRMMATTPRTPRTTTSATTKAAKKRASTFHAVFMLFSVAA